MTKKPTDILRL